MQDSLEDYLKLLKNTKNTHESPQIKREVLITVQVQQECNRRAMKIVEFCIDGRLRSETFLRCLPYINQSHYQDIIEERALTKLCGYPICGRLIPEMPNKQFHISTKLNKVYDITDRKNYCSNHCYKASIHIKKQIDNSPLWLRRFEQFPRFDLLKRSDGGLPGEEIDQGIAKPIVESSPFTSITSFAQFSLDEVVENELKSTSKSSHHNQMVTIEEEDLEESLDSEEIHKSNKNVEIKEDQQNQLKTKRKPKKKRKNIEYLLIEEQLLKSFKQWLNLDTFLYIYGEDRIKQLINDVKLNNYFEQLHISELHIEQQKRYLEICKKLNLRELTDRKFDNNIVYNTKLKPLPDYQQLKDESRQLDLKVKSFYSGNINVEIDHGTNDKNKERVDDDNGGSSIVLPLIDVNSQTALRRNIFLKSLNKALEQLLINLKIEPVLVLSDVQQLVKTFKLQANNIVFKPIVWNYIAIVLLQILTLKNEELEVILKRDSSKQYLDTIMNCLPSKYKVLDTIIDLMKNVDEFARFYISSNDAESSMG